MRASVTDEAAGGKAGYLAKKSSGLRSAWQRRYFILSGHYLRYYRDARCDELLAAVDLGCMRSIELVDWVFIELLVVVDAAADTAGKQVGALAPAAVRARAEWARARARARVGARGCA
jgi:hypothetical protein